MGLGSMPRCAVNTHASFTTTLVLRDGSKLGSCWDANAGNVSGSNAKGMLLRTKLLNFPACAPSQAPFASCR